jgi:hypothetical protein
MRKAKTFYDIRNRTPQMYILRAVHVIRAALTVVPQQSFIQHDQVPATRTHDLALIPFIGSDF